MALVTFSSQVNDVFDFSHDRASIATWLERDASQRPAVNGRTAFFDAVVAGTHLLQPAQAGDAIYAVTDGGENSSQNSQSATAKFFLQSNIRLFLFLFAETDFFGQGQADSLQNLAHETGGFVFGVIGQRGNHLFDFDYDDGATNRGRLKLQTRALNVQVNGFYKLQLETPPPEKKMSKVSLEVVDAKGIARKDMIWTYQKLLPASAN